MDDFAKWLEKNSDKIKDITSDDVRESMTKADDQEKKLCIALHGLFVKKRVSASNMIKALSSMDMMLSIFRLAAPDYLTEDLPDNTALLDSAKELVAAIDNVLSSLQGYSLANEKFNEVVRKDLDKKEQFIETSQRLENECIGESGLEAEAHIEEDE